MAMDDEGEKDEVADVEEDEYLAIFLGHTLTPPLVEATIMVMKQKNIHHLFILDLYKFILFVFI